MPCVRQYILERIRFDKKKRLQKADETKKVSSAFLVTDNEAKPIL